MKTLNSLKLISRKKFGKFHTVFFLFRCRICDDRFPSLILLEYHKEDEDHWSYASEDEFDPENGRETMDNFSEQETEFGPDEEEKEMLLTSAR